MNVRKIMSFMFIAILLFLSGFAAAQPTPGTSEQPRNRMSSEARERFLNRTQQTDSNTSEQKKDLLVPKERIKQIIHLKYAKAKDMAIMLQIMLPDITVYAHEELNALEIYDTAETIQEAKELIGLSDLPKRQVIIELTVGEISRTRSENIGLDIKDWSIDLKTILPPAILATDKTGNILLGTLNLQDGKTSINIKATPKVMITNRQQASILIGDRIPYEVATSGSGGQLSYSVQFVDVGIKLNVTPTIYANDEIDIYISAEASNVGKQTPRGYPEIGTRKAETYIHLKDQFTAILGGLVKEETRESLIGLPFLVKIPWIGPLFGTTKKEKVTTEVIISLTPKIVKPEDMSAPEKKSNP